MAVKPHAEESLEDKVERGLEDQVDEAKKVGGADKGRDKQSGRGAQGREPERREELQKRRRSGRKRGSQEDDFDPICPSRFSGFNLVLCTVDTLNLYHPMHET